MGRNYDLDDLWYDIDYKYLDYSDFVAAHINRRREYLEEYYRSCGKSIRALAGLNCYRDKVVMPNTEDDCLYSDSLDDYLDTFSIN